MFINRSYFNKLQEELRRLWELRENSNRYDEKQRMTAKRIRNSRIVFEKTDGIDNLYIDDELESEYQLVIYNFKTAIESSLTRYISRCDVENVPEIEVVGYLEMEYWDEKNGYIDIARLYVCPQYRRRGYASKMLGRLIECAEIYNVKAIALTACADDGIEQDDLESLYGKFGFKKEGKHSNRMICELK